jgi:regulator of cell morphogenesis and NO signaling
MSTSARRHPFVRTRILRLRQSPSPPRRAISDKQTEANMSTLDGSTTLASVVRAHPRVVRELERRGLDYCCHGDRTITDACRDAGLDPATVLTELEAAARTSAVEAWADLSPDQLVDHIETVHHRYLWDELPRLADLADKVVAVHGARHPELRGVAELVAAVRADLEPHLTKEEQVLFPMIRTLSEASGPAQFRCGRITNPISMMMREHEHTGDLLAQLRAATDAYRTPEDGCASFRALYDGLAHLEADTHLHIHKENNVLFPAVVQLEAQLLDDHDSA